MAAYIGNEFKGKRYNAMAAQNGNSFIAYERNAMAGRDSNSFKGQNYNAMAGVNYNTFLVEKNNLIACGYDNIIELSGAGNAIIAANGSKFKGKKGNAICMVEFDQKNNIAAIKSAIIDGEILKEDAWYELKDGEFIETK